MQGKAKKLDRDIQKEKRWTDMQKSEERKKGGQGRNAEVEAKAHFYQGKCQKKRDGPYVESINLDIVWTE